MNYSFMPFLILFLLLFSSCKDCAVCTYSTLKGGVNEEFCSSTKSDLRSFENRIKAEADALGVEAFCRRERQ